MQGMIALALYRMYDAKTAKKIIKSIIENAVFNDEMGMYFKEEWGWYWYQAPIETQALLIEAVDEIVKDQESVDLMKVWLLKQKQVQDWKTTKATAEACYALLLRFERSASLSISFQVSKTFLIFGLEFAINVAMLFA